MLKIPSLEELLEAGVHFGHQVRRGNPHMQEYIFGVRDGVHVINLESSQKMLEEAAKYIQKLGEEGKIVLFVGTKKQAQPIIQEVAIKTNSPYVTYKWLGGLLTNLDEIRKNINKLLSLKSQREKGELSRYTKKEQLLITRKLEKFEAEYGGVAQMDKLPDAIFFADTASEKTALAESLRLRLPVIGIADSNCDPYKLTVAIPGNDDATKSLQILIKTIGDYYQEGLKKAGKAKEKADKEADKQTQEAAKIDTAVSEQVAVAEEEIEKKATIESSRKE